MLASERRIRRPGLQIPGLGLGTPIYRLGFGDASSDLQVFQTALQAADVVWAADQAAGGYGNEIQAYQAAASAAVAVLPNELDSSQSALMQQASTANGQLQAINSSTSTDPMSGTTTGPTSSDAQSAHDLAYQIYNAYSQAANYSPAPTNLPPPSSTSGSGGSAGGTSNVTVQTSSAVQDAVVVGSVAAAAAGGWWLWKTFWR